MTKVRYSDPQNMKARRHRPRPRYHISRFSLSLTDSQTLDVSSVTRDVMEPATLRERKPVRETAAHRDKRS